MYHLGFPFLIIAKIILLYRKLVLSKTVCCLAHLSVEILANWSQSFIFNFLRVKSVSNNFFTMSSCADGDLSRLCFRAIPIFFVFFTFSF